MLQMLGYLVFHAHCDFEGPRIGWKDYQISRSKCAFATTLKSTEIDDKGKLQSIVVLGGLLNELSPDINRIILILNNSKIPDEYLQIIRKTWSQIIFKTTLSSKNDQQKLNIETFFKISLFELTTYERILYLSPSIMPLTDLSVYFDVSPPASILDLGLHAMNDLSPMFDTNFLLIKPNEYDRSILLKNIGNNIKTSIKISPESALFNKYLQNKITILPFNTVISCKDNHPNFLHSQPLKGILNASAVLFEHECEPWNVNNSFSTLWHQFVAYFGQTLEIHPNYRNLFSIDIDFSNVETFFYNSEEKSPNAKKYQSQVHDYQEDTDKDIYVYVNTTIKNILTTLVLILFTILFSLAFLKIVHIQFYEVITGSFYTAKNYILLK